MQLLRLCVWIAMAALSTLAHAQAAPPLSVTRGAGTDDCPDAAGLTARIEEIRKSPVPADQPPYVLTFARDDHGVYAQITSVQTGAERVLTDTSSACAALAQATAITLALLFDADARASAEPAAPPQSSPPAAPEALPPVVSPPPLTPPRDRAEMHRFIISYEAGALTGVVAPVSATFGLELGYAYGAWRASLGMLYPLWQPHELGSGSVLLSFTGSSLTGCFAPWRHRLWRLDACTGLVWASVEGKARGFGEVDKSARGWLTPALEARFGLLPDRFGAELRAALLIPTTRHDFAVEGAGLAYRSAPVALLFSLRLGWSALQSAP
jgi:hypothetical protein